MYFFLMGEWNPPEYVNHTLGGRLSNPSKGKQALKSAESHRCEVITVWILACNVSVFLRFPKGTHFRKSLAESERDDQF